MKNLIAKAFNESNTEYIAQYIITHLRQQKMGSEDTSLVNFDDFVANHFQAIVSRFFSLSVNDGQRHTKSKVLYTLLEHNLDTFSSESGGYMSSPRTSFVFRNSIAVNIVHLLCQSARSYDNSFVGRIFMDLALFFLRCFHSNAEIFTAGRSLKNILQDYAASQKKGLLHEVDYEGIKQIHDMSQSHSKFMIDPTAKLKNRHFEPLFALPERMDKFEVCRFFTEFNSAQRAKGESAIILSYATYSDLLCMKAVTEAQIFSIFQDLKEESEMTERNITVKKASQNLVSVDSSTLGLDEHANRKTWGCILARHLAQTLVDRFPNTFSVSEISTDGDARCKTSDRKLLPISSAGMFTPDLMRKIFDCLMSEASQAQKNDFLHLAEIPSHAKDLFIIDGLNVAYYARSRWGKSVTTDDASGRQSPRLHQIESVVQELRRQQIPDSSIKIILPHRHCCTDFAEKILIDTWTTKQMLVRTPDSLSDDLCWLYYALSHFTDAVGNNFTGRTFLLTNDQMRDHQTRILSGSCEKTFALFKQWKSIVQIFFDVHFADEINEGSKCNAKVAASVQLYFPPRVIYGIQCSADSSTWHVPFFSEEDATHSTIYANHNQCAKDNHAIKWLCGTR